VHTVRGKISYNNKKYGLLTYLNGRYQSNAEDLENEDIFVMNFYASKRFFDHTKIFLSAENLTDVVDFDIGLNKGRTFSLGLEAWY